MEMPEIKSPIVVEKRDDEEEDGKYDVETEYGVLKVTVNGAPLHEKTPVLLTYHDIGLNHASCFTSFFNLATHALPHLNKFTIVHIDAPGQYTGASTAAASALPPFDMNTLASHINLVCEKLNISSFIGFGVGAGAHVLSIYATKHREKVEGLILMGISAKKCGWFEWGYKLKCKLSSFVFGDVSLHDYFLGRWFSARSVATNRELLEVYCQELDRIPKENLDKFVSGYIKRADITEDLKAKIYCPVLLLVGDDHVLTEDTVDVFDILPSETTEFLKFEEKGLLLTAENPTELIQPIDLFLDSMGYSRLKRTN